MYGRSEGCLCSGNSNTIVQQHHASDLELMPSIELLYVFWAVVDDYNLGNEVEKSLRVGEGDDRIILVVSFNPIDKVHLQMDVGLFCPQHFVLNAPLGHIGLE